MTAACIAHDTCVTFCSLLKHVHIILWQVNSGAWGYALLNFRPNAIVYELWLYHTISPRGGTLHIGNPGMQGCENTLNMQGPFWAVFTGFGQVRMSTYSLYNTHCFMHGAACEEQGTSCRPAAILLGERCPEQQTVTRCCR